jgi:hypothetical protein
MYLNRVCLNDTGRILNEKMMPDVTVMVPELEIVNKQQQTTYRKPMFQWTTVVEQQTSRSCTHKPPISYAVFKNSWVQVPQWRFLKRLLACSPRWLKCEGSFWAKKRFWGGNKGAPPSHIRRTSGASPNKHRVSVTAYMRQRPIKYLCPSS